MKLDELRTVQSKERRKDSLQQLRDSFYEDVAAYLQDLKANRDRRADTVDDPFADDEIRRLSDELETAEEVAEAVYERRVGKVVKLASFAAADMPVDDEGMTGEERQLFDDLVDRISQNKRTVLDVIAGNSNPTETAESAAETPPPAGTSTATAEPDDDIKAEPATPSAESMLADAMGSDDASTTESAVEPSAHSTVDTATESTNNESESTANENAMPESTTRNETQPPDDVPPAEPQSEPDAVLETTTDGGTATETAATSPATGATESAAGSTEATTESTDTTVETSTPDNESAAGSTPSDDDSDRTTVRITRDVGEIFGVDGREYTLRSEDVVTLPTTNADPLVDRDAAIRLD